ncbi:hypothetical protein IEQ34_018297 [Dendrobium chrysotoxum]|uniref:Transducin/WD40 repeat-like superfamily protein n=1 Tax=Dendrobium chrysotoxum TaxID=161865 RepID=A0AAV7GDZ9_DENCH|nr:hypothetical protein IEQ34_018297 [Dendrobium chrysotoxum]
MKCPAVACLWPPSAPSHRITAVTVLLHNAPSLFTGGSDGAIVRWALSGHDVRPLALLCGHAAEIAVLAPCFPDSSNPMSSTLYPSALLSACADGVLCVWSAGSFRCRRRRKLPQWAGSPSHLAALPSLPRHVCIACSSSESSKSSVLIVDSSTLLMVQTVFHGSLGIGYVKSMAFVPLMDEVEKGKQAVFLVDGYGKAQFLALPKESGHDGEGSTSSMNRGSSSESLTSVWGESNSNDGEQAVAVAQDGSLLVLIYEFHCEFRSVLNGKVMGEVSLLDSNLGNEESSARVNLTGGLFLHRDVSCSVSETHVSEEDSPRSFCFAFCCSNGSAMVFLIFISYTVFNFQPLCEVPAGPLNSVGESLFHFCQLNDSVVRLESLSFSLGDLLVWKPSITIWSIVEFESIKESKHGSCSFSMLLGKGDFSDIKSFCHTKKLDEEFSNSYQQRESLDSSNLGILGSKRSDNGHCLADRIISSSMVLSHDFYPQYAIVYGFYSGEIEVAWLLSPSLNENSAEEDSLDPSNLRVTECFFLGHTGAVLCLAAHLMSESSSNRTLHRILVSGSMDCTVRIWNLDSGTLLLVMHHHIAPIKQIILPPAWTDKPWNDCFLSIGEDGCVALVSLETLRVERMFPGHPSYPSMVAWDSRRGYLACLCRSMPASSDSVDILYLWDVKTGARERIIRGSASHSMLDHFCKGINLNFINGSIMGGTTSASPLLLPVSDDSGSFQSRSTRTDVGTVAVSEVKKLQSDRKSTDFPESYSYLTNNNTGKLPSISMIHDANSDSAVNSLAKQLAFQHVRENKKHPIICFCPFPGIAILEFDLSSLVSLNYLQNNDEQTVSQSSNIAKEQSVKDEPSDGSAVAQGDRSNIMKPALEGYLLRFSLCFLHLWDIDLELDKLLKEEMDVCKPDGFEIAAGILGDRGSMTLMFPGLCASLELWKSSSEYCAMRSLIIVSLAECMIGLYHSTTVAGSALAAFYTRNFAERVQEIKPPLLQVANNLLVSFWQDPSEHVRMAARSLFHCAAPRAIPHSLYGQKTLHPGAKTSSVNVEEHTHSESDQTSASRHAILENSIQTKNADYEIVSWLDSFEIHEWVSCIGGTSQDAMASHIIVAAALVVWYPSKVKENLAKLVSDRLVKLVMSMNDRFSSTAAELLAEGMESSWKSCLGPEIPRLVGDIFFQIECLSGTPANTGKHNQSMTANIRESLVGILLPSLAMADIAGFLNVIEDQIWSTSSDSPVHLVSLKTLIRIVRGSPKPSALYLDKILNYVLQTMDPSNLVMRKACLKSSMLALKEIARVLPMVALNELSTRLAIGNAIGDVRNVTILVYDLESVTKIKILDASAPLGLPSLLEGASNAGMATAISALSFSPDGEVHRMLFTCKKCLIHV